MNTVWQPAARRGADLCVLAGLVLVLTGTAKAQEVDHSHALYDGVLKAHVRDGQLDYRALKSSPNALHRYLDEMAAVTESNSTSWDESRRLAFLLNLYNAATIRLILDHYPVKSIKDIGNWRRGPWDQGTVRLFGNTVTLNDLEHGILRKKYDEPRLHMALVCAAKGCPPLRNEAYRAPRLEEQLADQTRVYLASPAGMSIDRQAGKVFLSSILKWYGDDFVSKYAPQTPFAGQNEGKSAVLNFCARYAPEIHRRYLKAGSYSVHFLDYDWALNQVKGPR